jgi:hypothetical protein
MVITARDLYKWNMNGTREHGDIESSRMYLAWLLRMPSLHIDTIKHSMIKLMLIASRHSSQKSHTSLCSMSFARIVESLASASMMKKH